MKKWLSMMILLTFIDVVFSYNIGSVQNGGYDIGVNQDSGITCVAPILSVPLDTIIDTAAVIDTFNLSLSGGTCDSVKCINKPSWMTIDETGANIGRVIISPTDSVDKTDYQFVAYGCANDTASCNITITWGDIKLISFSPDTAYSADTITIIGRGFKNSQGTSTFTIGDSIPTIVLWKNDTQKVICPNIEPGFYSFIVCNGSMCDTLNDSIYIGTLSATITYLPSTSWTDTIGISGTHDATITGSTPDSATWTGHTTGLSFTKTGVNLGRISGSPTIVGTYTDSVYLWINGSRVDTAFITITVIIKLTITSSPSNARKIIGQTNTFSVSATGTGALHYQWKRNTINVGADVSTYTTPILTRADTNSKYVCLVTDNNGAIASDTATLSVRIYPVIDSLKPIWQKRGQAFRLYGSGFLNMQSTGKLKIGISNQTQISTWNDNLIVDTIPISWSPKGTYNIIVTNSDTLSDTTSLRILIPTITPMNP